jgi:hypothetical protein
MSVVIRKPASLSPGRPAPGSDFAAMTRRDGAARHMRNLAAVAGWDDAMRQQSSNTTARVAGVAVAGINDAFRSPAWYAFATQGSTPCETT